LKSSGFLPPGKSTPIAEPLTFNRVIRGFEVFSAGLEAQLYVSQDG
jgi:hypothetical protein